MMRVMVKAPGSCGELVQGTINGSNFLVTCPISMYSCVQISDESQAVTRAGTKTFAAVAATLSYFGISDAQFSVKVHSELPVGKGMASSSADISAACLATAMFLGKSLEADAIADIALGIEPTDGIFYPGIAMFDHVSGKIRRFLGEPPKMSIAIFDCGGQIDTLDFNKRKDLALLNNAKEAMIKQALDFVIAGLQHGDSKLIGKGATISALANQQILYKPHLDTIVRISERYGAFGVNVAHSGTVVGVMMPPEAEGQEACIKEIGSCCQGTTYLYTAQLVPGGLSFSAGGDQE